MSTLEESTRFCKLGDFLVKQHQIDQLQLELMKILYSNCYKIHMEKKLSKKKDNIKSKTILSMTEQERGLKDCLEIVDECSDNQCWFPRQDSSKYLDIGEEGWTIMAHWMVPIFTKLSNNGELKLSCETCGKLSCISQALEKFMMKRKEFDSCHEKALDPYEKYVDIWSQPKMRTITNAIFKLADHPSANAFTKGFSNCTMTYFNFSRELQGSDPKKPQTLVTVLEALTLNTSIYSIDVSDLLLVHDAAVKALCDMIRKKKNLKRIVFSSLSLGKSSYSSDIIKATMEAPFLSDICIYINENVDSKFRFLEETPANLLYKFANNPCKSFEFSVHEFSFPIETLSILEGLLKNRFLKRIQFNVRNSDQYLDYPFSKYVERMGNVIGSLPEFNFESIYIENISLNQKLHLMKKCKNPKKSLYLTNNDVLESVINDNLYQDIEKNLYFNCTSMGMVVFPHISQICKYITKLEIELGEETTETEWESLCSAIVESETLEELEVRYANILQEKNFNFSKLNKNSKLKKLLLATAYDSGVINASDLIADVAITFLNCETFPEFKQLVIGHNFEIDFKCAQIIVDCLNKQQDYYPKGITQFELGENSIQDPNCTDLLLKCLSHNRTIERLALYGAALENVSVFSDFILTNKVVKVLSLQYSALNQYLPRDMIIEEDFGASLLKVFGSLQLNWSMTAVDWFVEYDFYGFVLGSKNFVGERFLVQRIMERNRKQLKINKLMEPIRKKMQFSDVKIIIQ